AEIDDVPVALVGEARGGQLRPQDHAADIDVDLPVGDRVGLLEERPGGHDAGVVDEHVDPAELHVGQAEELVEGSPVGDVEGQSEHRGAEARTDPGGGVLHEILVDVADGHARAGRDEGFGRRLSDAACSAGDDNPLAVHVRAHVVSSFPRWACGNDATNGELRDPCHYRQVLVNFGHAAEDGAS